MARIQRFGIVAEKTTTKIFERLKKNMFKAFGSDLGSLNIQRGRDHGIPSYNDIRKFVGMPPIASMADRPPEISADGWAALAEVYSQPDDIDVYPAALAETPLTGGSASGFCAIYIHVAKAASFFLWGSVTEKNRPTISTINAMSPSFCKLTILLSDSGRVTKMC
jgi:hypothetical protein